MVSHRVDCRYPIDNNAIENAIRLFAIGLKNSMFSKSPAGANRNGLIQTSKDHGIEPYAFPRRVFGELPLAETMDDIDKLLPQAVKGIISQALTVNQLDADGFA